MAKVTTGVNGNNADMYRQNRGSNGQFGSGKSQASVAGGKNPLLYYPNGQPREIYNVGTGRGRKVSAGEFASSVNNAGAITAARRMNY